MHESFKVRASRILSFEGIWMVTGRGEEDPSLRSGQALNIEP
jgi:hypothetical protein